MVDLTDLAGVVREQHYPNLFATVSGAHLYGFPSVDSDVDLRGVHVLPAVEVVGLRTGPETITRSWDRDGVEIDLVTHDVAKFCRMLLRPNGYVLEQVLSPLVVSSSPAYEELVGLAPGCVTRHHVHHYRGFARSQWDLFRRTGELKPLLYTIRVLLTGIHLLRTGELVADLPALAELVPGPAYVGQLVAWKRSAEHGRAPDSWRPLSLVEADVAALHEALDQAELASPLPEAPTAEPALHDLLVRLRLGA